MKKLILEKPDLTDEQNKQLKKALVTVIVEAILCVVYVLLLILFMTDSNFRFFIVLSIVFYLAITVILCRSVWLINKLTKSSDTDPKTSLPQTEEKSDD